MTSFPLIYPFPHFLSGYKFCPTPTAYGEANVNTAGESGGQGARDRDGDKDSDRHGYMHMYEYTHMHNLRKEMVKIHTLPAHKH